MDCLKCFFDCPQGIPCDDFLDEEKTYDILFPDDNLTDVWYEMSYRNYTNRWIMEDA